MCVSAHIKFVFNHITEPLVTTEGEEIRERERERENMWAVVVPADRNEA